MIPVVIPAFKAELKLTKCLQHLKQQTAETHAYIRDNSKDNIYFTAAVNEGLRQCLQLAPAYVMILNQDMYLNENAVENLVAFMDAHPTCGIAQPLQLHEKDPNMVICGGGLRAFPFGKHSHGHISKFQDSAIHWCNGACMILRTEMIREIGLFDENFIFIGSDSDYCFTARSRGWEVWRCAGALGVHEAGESGHIADPQLERIKLEDMIYFAKKWLSGDLYRSLSEEGSSVTPSVISEYIQQLRAALISLDGTKLI
ncbi:MAG: glycosyltransferase family 2 protein [Halioglobus sp.]|nr:glycosyltransferase family 2 protein [Halioglobus sp.]